MKMKIAFIISCVLMGDMSCQKLRKKADLSGAIAYQEYNFTFVSRSEWNAREPKEITLLKTPMPYVVIHHTYIPGACYSKKECIAAVRDVQDFHLDTRGWADIGYHFLVGSDGAVYEGRGWKNQGAHSLYFNSISYGICLIGNWTEKRPPAVQTKVALDLIDVGIERGFIKPDYKLVGHRQVRDTQCPGDRLYGIIQKWPHHVNFPSTYKDLVNIPELPERVKKFLRNETQSYD